MTLDFPTPADHRSPAGEGSDLAAPGSLGVILVVEDDAEVRSYLATLLGAEGYDVREAQSGAEALEALRQGPLDAMILDLNLPTMNGFEVLERCRAIGRNTPTIVVSGMNDVDTVVRAMKLGATDYVTKPFDADELRMIVARVVTAREAEPIDDQAEAGIAGEGLAVDGPKDGLAEEQLGREDLAQGDLAQGGLADGTLGDGTDEVPSEDHLAARALDETDAAAARLDGAGRPDHHKGSGGSAAAVGRRAEAAGSEAPRVDEASADAGRPERRPGGREELAAAGAQPQGGPRLGNEATLAARASAAAAESRPPGLGRPVPEAASDGTIPVPGLHGGAFCGGPSMRRVWELIRQIADTDVPVLITGESGVGKDLVARAIHSSSARKDQLFVKINCAALPATLLESELFGHERGAFTGATRERPGKFELANHGTIFLDEIGEMPVDLQAKLLQALQDEEFFRVGGKRPVRVDVRVVAATNRDLTQAMREGRFREDLYFRLNVVHISVPPLRARRHDVGPLIDFFLKKYAGRYRKESGSPLLPEGLMQRLLSYSWPGNVRQLENVIRRWVVLRDERYVLEDLHEVEPPADGTEAPMTETSVSIEPPQSAPLSLLDIGRRAAREAEKVAIVETLTRTGWNKRRAAAELQVSYKALLYKIKECGIVSPHAAAAAAAARQPRRPTS